MEPVPARGYGLALLLAVGLAAPTLAQASQVRPFAPLPTLTNAEMASLRGGLEVAGLNVDITAQLKTYINERLALATEYRLTQLAEGRRMIQTRLREGRQTLQTALGQNAPAAPAAPATGEPAENPPGATGTGGGGGRVSNLPPGVQVTTTTQGQIGRGTVTVTGDTGITVVTHSVGPERVLSTVANTANGRQIRQELGVEITVHDFQAFSSRVRSALDARRIGRAASGGLLH